MNTISIKSVIGGQFAIDPDDGTKLYDEMKKYLDKNQDFSLDFKGIEVFVSPFASFSLGQVFVLHGEEIAQKVVDNAIDFEPQHKRCLDRIMRNFRRYSTVPAERVSAVVDKMAQELADGSWRDGMED